MAIGFYQIQSALPQQISDKQITCFLQPLSEAVGEMLEPISLETYRKEDFALLYVASGGSEENFFAVFDRLGGKPCYILTSGDSNSLAASMEILHFLQTNGCCGEILHGDILSVAARLRTLRTASRARSSIRGKNLGLIGKPSDWLISSTYSDEACAKRLGITIVKIQMEELLSEIARKRYAADEWTDRVRRCDWDAGEIDKALYVYGALQRVVERYHLAGVTIRCFDLLQHVATTGCVGVSILGAKGVYGGCEGDVPSLISMLILGELSQKPTFQCNPSRLDARAGTLQFAHCAIPLNMPDSFTLDTHFESKIGIGITGEMPETKVTVFKTEGDLSRYFVTCGELVKRPYEETLCRTQITAKLADTDYFLHNPIGNHHIVCQGDHTDAVQAFFQRI